MDSIFNILLSEILFHLTGYDEIDSVCIGYIDSLDIAIHILSQQYYHYQVTDPAPGV